MKILAVLLALTGFFTLQFQVSSFGILFSLLYIVFAAVVFMEIIPLQFNQLIIRLLLVGYAVLSLVIYLTEPVYPEIAMVNFCFVAIATIGLSVVNDRLLKNSNHKNTPLKFNFRFTIKNKSFYLNTLKSLLAIFGLGLLLQVIGAVIGHAMGPTGGVTLILPFIIAIVGIFSTFVSFLLLSVLLFCYLIDGAVSHMTDQKDKNVGLRAGIIAGVLLLVVMFLSWNRLHLDRKLRWLDISKTSVVSW